MSKEKLKEYIQMEVKNKDLILRYDQLSKDKDTLTVKIRQDQLELQ